MLRLVLALLVGVAGVAVAAGESSSAPLDGPTVFEPARATKSLVYVSGMFGTDRTGRLVGGGIRPQVEQALDNVARQVERAGSRLRDVASVTFDVARREDVLAIDDAYRRRWRSEWPARTILVVPLVMPSALVEVSAVAGRSAATRSVVQTSADPVPAAALVDDVLFTSALHDDGSPTIAAQTAHVLDQLDAVLRRAGLQTADVVRARPYVAQVDRTLDDVYVARFTAPVPARQLVQANLSAPTRLVDMVFEAVRTNDRERINDETDEKFPGRGVEGRTSPAIRAGARLFTMGTNAGGYFLSSHRNDAAAQAREAASRIDRVLRAAKFTRDDVVDVLVCLSDVSRVDEVSAALRDAFSVPRPAGSIVGIRPASPDAMVELSVTAERGLPH